MGNQEDIGTEDRQRRHGDRLAASSAVGVTPDPARAGRDAAAGSPGPAELLSLLGHDLRNPLNAIATAVEVLNRADSAAPEAQSARRIIGRQVQRLAHLLDDLAEIGRALDDRTALVRRPVDFGTLLQGCVARAAPKAAAKGQRFRADGAGCVDIVVEADADALAQALDRLLEESSRRSRDDGTLAVQLRKMPGDAGPEAVLLIGDAEGAALRAAADRPSLPPAAARQGGDVDMSLGLALARRIVAQHGGRVDARSADAAASGGVFIVRLPTASAPGAELATTVDPSRPRQSVAGAATERPVDATAPFGDLPESADR